jgi:PKD repeat protein
MVGDAAAPVVAGFVTLDDRRTGVAPLRVTFLPVTRGVVTTYRWEFGDGTAPESSRAPEHLYQVPGSYRVSLSISGPGGSDSLDIEDYIEVLPAADGDACSNDDQCAGGTCLCGGDDNGCPSSLQAGLCGSGCATSECGAGTLCIDLGRSVGSASPPSAPAASSVSSAAQWQQAICLPRCTQDADCLRPGFRCRALPPAAGPGAGPGDLPAYVSACLSTEPRAIGQPCAENTAAPAPGPQGGCAFGVCLDHGLNGLCSAPCRGAADCPPDTACVRFASATDADAGVCLLRCESAGLCTSAPGDPLLGCELPGGPGPDGFNLVDSTTPTGRFCSPRRCRTDEECAPGRCQDGTCRRAEPDGGPADGGPDADGGSDGGDGGDGGPDALDGGDGPQADADGGTGSDGLLGDLPADVKLDLP